MIENYYTSHSFFMLFEKGKEKNIIWQKNSVFEVIGNNPSILNICDSYGRNLLSVIAKNYSEQNLNFTSEEINFIARHSDCLKMDCWGYIPVMYAIEQNNILVFKVLFEYIGSFDKILLFNFMKNKNKKLFDFFVLNNIYNTNEYKDCKNIIL